MALFEGVSSAFLAMEHKVCTQEKAILEVDVVTTGRANVGDSACAISTTPTPPPSTDAERSVSYSVRSLSMDTTRAYQLCNGEAEHKKACAITHSDTSFSGMARLCVVKESIALTRGVVVNSWICFITDTQVSQSNCSTKIVNGCGTEFLALLDALRSDDEGESEHGAQWKERFEDWTRGADAHPGQAQRVQKRTTATLLRCPPHDGRGAARVGA